MASLYKKANWRQQRIFRIIEGAVINVAHVHNLDFDLRFAKSIAKRATGTLTAQWSDVLATPLVVSSELMNDHAVNHSSTRFSQLLKGNREGRRSTAWNRLPLRSLHKAIGKMAGEAKRNNDIIRHEALVDVLKMIARDMEE